MACVFLGQLSISRFASAIDSRSKALGFVPSEVAAEIRHRLKSEMEKEITDKETVHTTDKTITSTSKGDFRRRLLAFAFANFAEEQATTVEDDTSIQKELGHFLSVPARA